MIQAIPTQWVRQDPVVLNRIVTGFADPECSVLQPLQGRIDISEQMLETRRTSSGQSSGDSLPPREELAAYSLVADRKRQRRFIDLLHRNLLASHSRSYTRRSRRSDALSTDINSIIVQQFATLHRFLSTKFDSRSHGLLICPPPGSCPMITAS